MLFIIYAKGGLVDLMNTKKKAIFTIIAAIIVLALVIIGVTIGGTSQAQAGTALNTDSTFKYSFELDEIKDYEFPKQIYQDEGYSDLASWWEALKEKRASFEGIAQENIDSLGEYISEEDQALLRLYEAEMLRASNFTKLGEKETAFNAIVDAANAEKERVEAEAAALAAQATTVTQTSYIEYQAAVSSGNYSGSYYDFLSAGVVNHNGNKYTYYSQSVLPGGGLSIPGRHVDGGFVKDADGYICVANSSPNGTVIDTPWGAAKVYDKGTSGNHYDIYVE